MNYVCTGPSSSRATAGAGTKKGTTLLKGGPFLCQRVNSSLRIGLLAPPKPGHAVIAPRYVLLVLVPGALCGTRTLLSAAWRHAACCVA